MNNHISIIELKKNNSGIKRFIGKNWPMLSFQNKEISMQFQKRSLWDSWCNHGFERGKNNFSLLRLNKVVRFRWVMMNSECNDFYFSTVITYYFWKMLSKFNSNLENLHYPVNVFMNIISKWMRWIKLRESMSGDTFILVRSPYGLTRGNFFLGYI